MLRGRRRSRWVSLLASLDPPYRLLSGVREKVSGEEVALALFGIRGEVAEAGVLIGGAGVLVDDELDEVGIAVARAQSIEEDLLAFDGDPLIAAGVDRLEGDLTPSVQVRQGVFARQGLAAPVAEHLPVPLVIPRARGRLDGSAAEGMLVAEAGEGGHAAGRHSADRHAVRIEDGHLAQGIDDLIDLIDHLEDEVQRVVRMLKGGIVALAVPGQIDSAEADAGAKQPQRPCIQITTGTPPEGPPERARGRSPGGSPE